MRYSGHSEFATSSVSRLGAYLAIPASYFAPIEVTRMNRLRLLGILLITSSIVVALFVPAIGGDLWKKPMEMLVATDTRTSPANGSIIEWLDPRNWSSGSLLAAFGGTGLVLWFWPVRSK